MVGESSILRENSKRNFFSILISVSKKYKFIRWDCKNNNCSEYYYTNKRKNNIIGIGMS